MSYSNQLNSRFNKFIIFIGLSALFCFQYYNQAGRLDPYFINSDTLYLSIFELDKVFDFRSPPATYIFPDYFFVKLVSFFVSDAYLAILYAGYLQILAVAIVLVVCCGSIPALLALSIAVLLSLQDVITITNHFCLPLILTILISLDLKKRKWLTIPAAMFDPFILVPVSFYFSAIPGMESIQRRNAAVYVFLGWVLVFLYAETSKQMLFLLPLLALFFVVMIFPIQAFELVRRRYGENLLAGIMLILAFFLFILEGQPQRYSIPLFVMGIIFIFWSPNFNMKRIVGATVIALFVLFNIYVNNREVVKTIKEYEMRYECLAKELEQRGIYKLGVDYITSKPIYLASGHKIDPVVLDYQRWEPFLWLSPNSWAGGTVSYFVQDALCESQEKRNCSQEHFMNAKKEIVCGRFAIYETNQPINFVGPVGKLESFKMNFDLSFRKFQEYLDRKFRKDAIQ